MVRLAMSVRCQSDLSEPLRPLSDEARLDGANTVRANGLNPHRLAEQWPRQHLPFADFYVISQERLSFSFKFGTLHSMSDSIQPPSALSELSVRTADPLTQT